MISWLNNGLDSALSLGENADRVLERRYLKRNRDGKVLERSKEMFARVARAIAQADLRFDPNSDIESLAARFFAMMTALQFMPNSPTLMNAGRRLGQLSACFVLPVEDSMESIFEAVKIHRHDTQIRRRNGIFFLSPAPQGRCGAIDQRCVFGTGKLHARF